MSGYIKFYDEAELWLRVVLSALGVPAFLYRLFKVIIDKAHNVENLIFLILNVIPIVGTIIWVFDIVRCAMSKPLPCNFAGWWSNGEAATETKAEEKEEVKEEPKQVEEKPAEEPKAE